MLREEGGERGRKRQTDRHPSERETSTSYLLVCALTGDWTHKPQLGSNALMLTSAPAVWLCHPWRTLCEYQNQNTRRQYLRLKRPRHSVARRSAQKAERARVPTGPAARRWPGSVACGSPQLLDQLASALGLSAGRLQQGLPKRVPAFLLTRFCPLQAAEVLIFLLKVSAKLGHPGAPTLRVIVIWPGRCKERSENLVTCSAPGSTGGRGEER